MSYFHGIKKDNDDIFDREREPTLPNKYRLRSILGMMNVDMESSKEAVIQVRRNCRNFVYNLKQRHLFNYSQYL